MSYKIVVSADSLSNTASSFLVLVKTEHLNTACCGNCGTAACFRVRQTLSTGKDHGEIVWAQEPQMVAGIFDRRVLLIRVGEDVGELGLITSVRAWIGQSARLLLEGGTPRAWCDRRCGSGWWALERDCSAGKRTKGMLSIDMAQQTARWQSVMTFYTRRTFILSHGVSSNVHVTESLLCTRTGSENCVQLALAFSRLCKVELRIGIDRLGVKVTRFRARRDYATTRSHLYSRTRQFAFWNGCKKHWIDHNYEQAEKVVPFITSEGAFGQNVASWFRVSTYLKWILGSKFILS